MYIVICETRLLEMYLWLFAGLSTSINKINQNNPKKSIYTEILYIFFKVQFFKLS